VKRVLPLLLAAALGCSNITDSGDGVVALEVKVPARLELEAGDTIQLAARALDRNGDSVDAAITWLTPDTTVGVVAATGQVTGRFGGPSIGRVQAAEGTLVSDFLTFTVVARADSLALPSGAAVTVPAGTVSSPPLDVKLLGAPDAQMGGHRLIFTVTAPVFADPALRTVQLPNAALVDTVLTGVDGAPVAPVTLELVAGTTAPATATVQVAAVRPSGASVPGSGQTFTVTFQ
jgi:hypothetical protein